jgi:hypothetical protein
MASVVGAPGQWAEPLFSSPSIKKKLLQGAEAIMELASKTAIYL